MNKYASQYLSRIYYFNESQKLIAEKIIQQLMARGFSIATDIKPVKPFWPAETDHQHYDQKTKQVPYCHAQVKRFE